MIRKILLIIFLIMFFSGQILSENIDYKSMLKEVSSSLLSVVKKPENKPWPPIFSISESPDLNAYSIADTNNKGKITGYKVKITTKLLEQIVGDNKNKLSYLLSHEIAHILLGHVDMNSDKIPDFLSIIYSRNEEYKADELGMKIGLEAGYSTYKAAFDIFRQMRDEKYSPIQGLESEHPSFEERLEYFDTIQTKLWHSMSAFKNGTYFLAIEDYIKSERCFRKVTEEFPKCSEAWSNLGYTRLMVYMANLTKEDFEQQGIGYLVIGAYYRSPYSLSSNIRGRDDELWYDAVGDLRRSLDLNPNLTLAKSNLGVAYLLHPNGRPDFEKADKYFQEALELVDNDTTLSQIAKSAVYINAGVSNMSANKFELSIKSFEKAQNFGKAFTNGLREYPDLENSIHFNNGFLEMNSKNPDKLIEAKKNFEYFLINIDNKSPWFSIARTNYEQICKSLMQKPKSFEKINPKRNLKPVNHIKYNEKIFALSDDIDEKVLLREGFVKSNIIENTTLIKYSNIDKGLEIISTNKINAIVLKNENSPEIIFENSKKENHPIKIGMKIKDFEKLIGKDAICEKSFTFINNNQNFQFYSQLGIAVNIENNNLKEIIILPVYE
jgi:tetratricopeptide (TPR) repeat protein